MNAKETAEAALELADDSELGAITELLARHVLAQSADVELQVAVPLAELVTLTRRYTQLCAHVGAEDAAGRRVLEQMLDATPTDDDDLPDVDDDMTVRKLYP